MEIIILPSPVDVGHAAVKTVASVIARKRNAAVGLATGSSPLAIYDGLSQLVKDGALDTSEVRGFALDEYVGIAEDHPESYVSVINRTVTEPLQLNPANVHVPDGRADDIDAACEAYEESIRDAGGVDIQILGIGSNAHVGFNEPTSSFGSRTRIKTLTPQTRVDNARFFDSIDQVPTHCVTQGLGTIMDARALVLVAQGENKADAIAAAVEGPVSSMCPASILQFHRHASIIIDEAAASQLKLTDYYRYAYENKPSWQL